MLDGSLFHKNRWWRAEKGYKRSQSARNFYFMAWGTGFICLPAAIFPGQFSFVTNMSVIPGQFYGRFALRVLNPKLSR